MKRLGLGNPKVKKKESQEAAVIMKNNNENEQLTQEGAVDVTFPMQSKEGQTTELNEFSSSVEKKQVILSQSQIQELHKQLNSIYNLNAQWKQMATPANPTNSIALTS